MTVDPLVSLLIGALGASLIALIGGLIGAAIQTRREHARWIREQRFEAYVDFYSVTDRHPSFYTDPEGFTAFLDDQGDAIARIDLIGSKAMVKAAMLHRAALSEVVTARDADGDRREAAGLDRVPSRDEPLSDELVEVIASQVQTRTRYVAVARRELGVEPMIVLKKKRGRLAVEF